ncbi:flagellar basal body-associated FliL family protein [Sanguibacter sp. A247]|uniref:flagellar basal body-associated FliL family protein n=1 Tax=unclassified Sanguibacter TaxID=2645534 RepID=UPI003FD7BFEC
MAVVEQRVVGAPRQKIGAGRGAQAPEPEPTPEVKPGRPSWVKFALIAVLAAVLAAGLTVYLVVLKPDADARKAAEPPVPGAIVQLEPMNVNLAAGKYLRVGLGLQLTADAGAEFDVTRAKDAVITLLTGREVTDVATPEGREAVREALEEQLGVAYEGHVMSVYFTDFVTQ